MNLQTPLAALIVGLAFGQAAAAQEGPSAVAPSYDCSASELNLVETTICQVESLAVWDVRLSELYFAVIEEFPDQANLVREEQRAFLRQRNKCGEMVKGEILQDDPVYDPFVSCIYNSYLDRLVKLGDIYAPFGWGTQVPGDHDAPTIAQPQLTGRYLWENSWVRELFDEEEEIYNFGEVDLWRTSAWEGYIRIATVMGPTYHSCWFEGPVIMSGFQAIATGIEHEEEGPWVLGASVTPDGQHLSIASDNTQFFCGMRATLDGLYPRR